MSESTTVMDYDPNLTNSGRMAVQTVRLTFAQWDYRLDCTVEVRGNLRGSSVHQAAVRNLFDELLKAAECQNPRFPIASITLKRASDGGELICDDDEDQGEDWLGDMLIAAEVLSIRPLPR